LELSFQYDDIAGAHDDWRAALTAGGPHSLVTIERLQPLLRPCPFREGLNKFLEMW